MQCGDGIVNSNVFDGSFIGMTIYCVPLSSNIFLVLKLWKTVLFQIHIPGERLTYNTWWESNAGYWFREQSVLKEESRKRPGCAYRWYGPSYHDALLRKVESVMRDSAMRYAHPDASSRWPWNGLPHQ